MTLYILISFHKACRTLQVALEVDLDTIYKPGSLLDMPKRPQWNYEETKFLLESREQAYFKVPFLYKYLSNTINSFSLIDSFNKYQAVFISDKYELKYFVHE